MDLRDRFTEMREMDLQVQSKRHARVTPTLSTGTQQSAEASIVFLLNSLVNLIVLFASHTSFAR